jgi:hypothetical protein
MFCPECKAEYRPGFTHCSDCDAELVEKLPQSDNGAENELTNSEPIRRLWSGKDQARCVSICEQLKRAEIPFKVDQHQRQYLLRVDEQYRIGVPPGFFNDARKIIKG